MWRDDRGFATVAGAFAIAAIAATVVTLLYVGAAVVARHRAQSAADLAVLAAAQQQVAAEPDPCAAARRIAAAQDVGAEVERCVAEGADMLVTVAVPVQLGPFGVHRAQAVARAGPVG
ncbi:Rv3654c family TadE-like protein [Gordonia sp. DT218]|uniref:Rv3654c family TadE-like protein n=1 Tax=unclassified Gordonia (in: high G+C Gram-positive bacteria) TaxID=2657482 RepID=UPI003CF40C65